MKIHKTMMAIFFTISIIMLIISLIFAVKLKTLNHTSAIWLNTWQNIIIGIMASLFVAGLVALVSYFHERSRFFLNLYSNLFSIYYHLCTLQIYTNRTCSDIERGLTVDKLNIDSLSIGNLAYEVKKTIKVFEYVPLIKRLDKQRCEKLQALNQYLFKITDIQHKINSITIKYLEYEKALLEKELYINYCHRTMKNTFPDIIIFESKIYNLIMTISNQCGGLHGYTSSAISELESNILGLYNAYYFQPSWDIVKKDIESNLYGIKARIEK